MLLPVALIIAVQFVFRWRAKLRAERLATR